MAKTKEVPEEAPIQETHPEKSKALAVVDKDMVTDLFKRDINSTSAVRSITIKRTLTKPLVAMKHCKYLMVEFTSDMYLKPLPNSGRGGGLSDAVVADAVLIAGDAKNAGAGAEITLILNTMMISSIASGAYESQKAIVKDGLTTGHEKVPGATIIGKAFAFRAGDIKEDAKYRVVETVEVSIER